MMIVKEGLEVREVVGKGGGEGEGEGGEVVV